MDKPLMKSLGRYEILTELGRGAMGVVYLGQDAKIDRKVALKCIRSELFEESEEARKRFQGEILALGRLVHPNIVTIFDTGEDNGVAYIVMEYVEGNPLSEFLKEGTLLPLDQIVRIGLAVCQALDFAHSKGVIHRDVKPGNILLTPDLQTVKVTDFGIARLDRGGFTQTNQVLGTPRYMSPEQCKGAPVDGRSDLFSLGTLLYEFITRHKPFSAENIAAVMHQVMTYTPDPPETYSPDIPKSLSDIVMKAMGKNPAQRFTTGAEMANALASVRLHQEKRDLDATTMATRRTERAPRRRRIWAGALTMVVGIGVLVGVYIVTGALKPPIPSEEVNPTPPEIIPAAPSPSLSDIPSDEGAPSPMGTVNITSTPVGSDVLINGELKGVTPLALDLSAGAYALVLNKEGYYPMEATLTVAAGETIPMNITLTEEEEER